VLKLVRFRRKVLSSMSSAAQLKATVDDLYRETGKAELTLVVWDLDPVSECVNIYRYNAPDQPDRRERARTADAEPAVPGWSIRLDELFA
jgi:hypothetical protein